MRGRGGVVWRGEEGEDEEVSGRCQSLKAFERLTSDQMGSPETRDLREQGRKSTACSVSARGQKERGKEGRKDVVSPLGDSQRVQFRPGAAKLICSTTISTMSTVDNNCCVIIRKCVA